MKTCSKCKNIYSTENFTKDKRTKDGLDPRCKSCSRAQCREWSRKKREQFRLSPDTFSKLCRKCGQVKNNKRFHRNAERSDGLQRWCKECVKAYMGSDRAKSVNRKWYLKSKFGISESEYLALIERHKDSCAICGIHKNDYGRRLHVDHCHSTNRVRGILCYKCNALLGYADDNPDRLRSAIAYLSENISPQ